MKRGSRKTSCRSALITMSYMTLRVSVLLLCQLHYLTPCNLMHQSILEKKDTLMIATDKVVPEVEKSLITVFREKMGTTIGDTELVLKCGGCCQPWHYTPHDCSGCGCPMHTWCGAPAVEWEEGHGAHHKCPLCSSMKNPKTPASKSGVSTT